MTNAKKYKIQILYKNENVKLEEKQRTGTRDCSKLNVENNE